MPMITRDPVSASGNVLPTQDRLTMPRILQNPPTNTVMQRRIPQPVPVPYIVLPRAFEDLPPRQRKLRTAVYTNLLRDGHVGEELGEGVGVRGLGVCALVAGLEGGFEFRDRFGGFYFVRAAQRPGAAHVCIADFVDVGELEVLERGHAVCGGESVGALLV